MTAPFNFHDALARAEQINWRIDDLIGGDKRLDFSKPFLPESLARTAPLTFLSADEKRVLNQIRGHGYLYTFGLVEEFILPFVLDHVRPSLDADDARVRALLQFAVEEAKHIELFKRFRDEFLRDFGTHCEVIGPPKAVADAVLAHDPLAVALVILGIEWMTQKHYTESVRDDASLDPQFKSLLKHHWMEEMQHAQMDSLMVEALAEGRDQAGIDAAIDGYLAIGAMFDEAFKAQVDFDLAAFEAATGRALSADEAVEFRTVQLQALRWTYLGSGLTHPQFRAALDRMGRGARERLDEVAPAFC